MAQVVIFKDSRGNEFARKPYNGDEIVVPSGAESFTIEEAPPEPEWVTIRVAVKPGMSNPAEEIASSIRLIVWGVRDGHSDDLTDWVKRFANDEVADIPSPDDYFIALAE